MKGALETVYGLSLWVMLIWSIIAQDWWLFAPAAFLLLLDAIGDEA